eukprot:221131_1
MSSYDLAVIFAPCLQSNQYLYRCRTKHRRDKSYETQFRTAVQVLIHYADVLFPGLDRVRWQALSFLHFLGQERELVRYYNRLYSNNAKIQHCVPHILKKGADYGFFIDALHDHKRNHVMREPIHPLVVT